MTYERPGYPDLLARIQADLDALPATLRQALSASLARTAHGMHGHLAWIDAQCSPLTCELERLYDWAGLYGADRLLATPATGTVLATGTAGSMILAGTLLRGANGLDYSVLEAVTLDETGASPVIRCITAGSAGNQAAGLAVSLVDPIIGVESTLTVGAEGLTGGAEDEDLEVWRARVAAIWRQVVTVGAPAGRAADYIHWSRQAHPSVSGAIVQPHALGIGTVLVRPFCDALPDRLPTAAVLEAVSALLASVAPATADWRIAAPIPRVVTLSLHLLPGYDTAQNRAAIEAALHAIVTAETAAEAVLSEVEIDYAISTVTTQYQFVGAPPVDIQAAPGEILTFGGVAWS